MYNFDEMTNRFNTSSLKWDVLENELPMWVADMDFKVCPDITKAIIQKANEGIYGYNVIPDDWYNAYINWWGLYHNLSIKKENLIFSSGVVPSISSIIRKMSTPAEKVVILTPVYNIFYNSIINNGRRVLECRLKYEDSKFDVDYEKLEEYLADRETSILLFCNPHNPTGHVWTSSELKRIGDLCLKHHVLIISDEIHCDLCDDGVEYHPFASISEEIKQNVITLIAPTKTFNMAGIQTSAILIYNKYLMQKVDRGINTDEIAEPNTFACTAAIAAFNTGRVWNLECIKYIGNNKKEVINFINKVNLKLKVVKADALYLMWVDVTSYTQDSQKLCDFIRKETGLYVSSGPQFGLDGFIRLNVACPLERLKDGLQRLKIALEMWCKND